MNGVVDIVMNSDCNFNCSYCYQRKSKNAKPLEIISKEVIDRSCELISTVYKNDKITVNLIGGEPLLHQEIFEYAYRCFHKLNNVIVNITTNGSLIDNYQDLFIPERTKFFISYDFLFQDLRCRNTNEKIENNIKLLVNQGFIVSANTLFQIQNFVYFADYIENIKQFRNGITKNRNLLSHFFSFNADSDLSLEKVKEIKEYLISFSKKVKLTDYNIKFSGTYKSNKEEIFLGIAPNGDLYPGYSSYFVDRVGCLLFANIFENFNTIRLKRMKKEIEIEYKRSHSCDDCKLKCTTRDHVPVSTDLSQWGKKKNGYKCYFNEIFTKYF